VETFEPALELKAQYRSQKGDVYGLEGLRHEDQRNLTRREKLYHPEVMTQRYASYALTIPSLAALAYTAWLCAKTRPTKPRTIEETTKPFREIIAEIAEQPTLEGNRTSVEMKSFPDLARVAEELVKPILSQEIPALEPKGGRDAYSTSSTEK
jgi:hypothetical protein